MSNENKISDAFGQQPNTPPTALADLAHLNIPPKLVLRESEVTDLTGLSASSIRNRCNPLSPWYDHEFPLPVSLSNGKRRSAIGWRTTEIVHWIATRPRVFDLRQLDSPKKRIKRPRNPATTTGTWWL